MNPWLMIVIGWASMAVIMSLLWLLQRRTGDSGIVDVAWGLGVGSLACFFCWFCMEGNPIRRIIIAVLAMAWAVRLSAYVLSRVLKMPEDGRYQTLKENWGAAAQARMFRFYQLQAFGSLLFSLPMLIAAGNSHEIGPLDYLGIAIWIIAIAGESLADFQLASFRNQAHTKGQVCQRGLWRYSRHPNYFFEWLHWWSYVCLAIGGPYGWLAILFPMVMLFFILKLTGIPPTEAQAIKSRGDAYREYQRTTSPFFPWPPKKSGETA